MPWTEVGDRVFFLHYPFLNQNIGVILGEEGVMVVDTRSTPSQGLRIKDDLASLTRLPIRWVVNTHHHWDHAFGNMVFTGAEIWGHEICHHNLVENAAAVIDELARDRRIAGNPEMADLSEVVIVPPDHTFSDQIELDLGSQPVELRYLGRGHTDGDIVVRAAGVNFAGDLVEEGAPPTFDDSFPQEWVGTLAAMAQLPDRAVVPGHGQVVDLKFVAGQREHIQAAVDWFTSGGEAPYPKYSMDAIAARLDA